MGSSKSPTLLEAVLIAILILVGAALIVPRLRDRSDSPGHDSTASDLSAIQEALAQFAADTGQLPTTSDGLEALVNGPSGQPNWRGPYVLHPPKDPWGNPYLYRSLTDTTFDLRSAGHDGKPGTEDDIVARTNPGGNP